MTRDVFSRPIASDRGHGCVQDIGALFGVAALDPAPTAGLHLGNLVWNCSAQRSKSTPLRQSAVHSG